MLNRAGMHIYHPHPHEATATQVYRGLAGAIIVNDEEERAIGLPSGEFELPIVIQHRTLSDANQLIYGGGMHMSMFGVYGERILVNGWAGARFDVPSSAYRLRVMNGSNARIYKLAWDDGTPIIVIGVDGGLLDRLAAGLYNHQRLHSTLGYLSPMAFEKRRLADKERLVA